MPRHFFRRPDHDMRLHTECAFDQVALQIAEKAGYEYDHRDADGGARHDHQRLRAAFAQEAQRDRPLETHR